RDLSSSRSGLSSREVGRRLAQYGPNELSRRGGPRWPAELGRQLTHPLALLLWLASALSFAVGNRTVAIAVLLVILLNAAFAFVQEMQAERSVEALAGYMPQHARVLRDGAQTTIGAAQMVPGDIAVLAEGDRVAADMRLLSGAVEIDLSTLTGESVSVLRAADLTDRDVPRLQARDLVFSGTTCTGGEALAVVFATGMHTELGRIATLSQRVKDPPSPLERQVRRVAWLIAAIAVVMSLAFIPLAVLGAGLSLRGSVVFAVGLLAGNVPEGLLPVITLALAVAVGALAREGALVKRLSAVETLGSTDVICTDKTGTLTENRMRPAAVWTATAEIALGDGERVPDGAGVDPTLHALALTGASCSDATLGAREGEGGDPTEVAVLSVASLLGADTDPAARERLRVHRYNFDPELKLMSTLDRQDARCMLHTKGAPEAVLPRCASLLGGAGVEDPLDEDARRLISERVAAFASSGLRVLALARRELDAGDPPPREQAERELCFLGLVAMLDPPRAE
ncbi:MAG TPA: HAD-IC family P-type ATPase, partial [Solirubrobacteraceae bacterium]